MRKRLTQKESIFYALYKSFKGEESFRFIPVFEFMGEHYCQEVGKWGFVSHECSARASEMKKENPELIERKTIQGKSGARYYGYRINPYVKPEMIKDSALASFHKQVMSYRQKVAQQNV